MDPHLLIRIAAWLAAGLLAMILSKYLYVWKSPRPLPPEKPTLCFLPKYAVQLPIRDVDASDTLPALLARSGFHESRRSSDRVTFVRGTVLGDFTFSVKIIKIVITTSLPTSSPLVLNVEYGAMFGCAFDTGDLWTFCHELGSQVEDVITRQNAPVVESGNPYQPPAI